MNTFTVTFHHNNNYGAILQAYALQQALMAMGHDNTILEYPHSEQSHSRNNFKNPKAVARAAYVNYIKFTKRNELQKRDNCFESFHQNKLKLSQNYHDMAQLREDCIDYDALITGSDQVWRFLGNREFIPARFLDFGKNGVRKFSYAASIERLDYSEDQQELVRNWLKDFYAISLREQSAADYIHSVTGYDTTTVLDPVFLLDKDKWMEIAKPPRIQEKYILCYQVQSSPMMQKTVDYLKRLTGYKTVSIIPYSVKWIRTDYSLFDVSPEEFIGLFSNAEIVVSEAFHGNAFAHVFNKPVYATVRSGCGSRTIDIMKLFGAEEYCILDETKLVPPQDYPFDSVQDKLAVEKEKSLSYLRKCLTEE